MAQQAKITELIRRVCLRNPDGITQFLQQI
jgi:hypothetical protein